MARTRNTDAQLRERLGTGGSGLSGGPSVIPPDPFVDSTYGLDHPVRPVASHLRKNEGQRLIIFNTKNLSVTDVWAELRACLGDDMFRSIIRLERITHLNRNPRTDMWVTKEAAASLMRAIRSMTRERTPLFCEVVRDQIRDGAHRTRALGSWRLAIWQPWKDRVGPSVTVDSGKARKETSAVLTLNVNGFVHKKWELAEILRKENVAIACLQETVVGDKQYPVRLSGYNTFDVPWQEGFRGQAVLVDSRLPAYEVPHGEQFVIHVKVSRFHGFKRPLHVLGVYLPSGGNFRRERTSRFNKLVGICRDILRSEPGAVIVALGDFNMPVPRIRSLSPADAEVLARLTPVGSALSRFPRRGKPGAIDHVMVSGAAKQAFRRPRVLRQYCLSDHRPVVVHPLTVNGAWQEPQKTFRFDSRRLRLCSEKIASDNRWRVLVNSVDANTPTRVEDCTRIFTDTFDKVTRAHGVKVPNIPQGEHLPRKLRRLLTRIHSVKRKVDKLVLKGKPAPPPLVKDITQLKRIFNKKRSEWERGSRQKLYSRIAEDFVSNDHKNVWSRLRAQTSKVSGGPSLHPVKDEAGQLVYEVGGILEAMRGYYETLFTYDPDGLANNQAYWQNLDLPQLPDIPRINDPIEWREVLMALRSANRNTAPGRDGVHINVLKSLVLEECMAWVKEQNPNFRRPDNVRLDLPKDQLPDEPKTLFGKALNKILLGVWEKVYTPSDWNFIWIINLFKSGDPELLSNYRGISLISCAFKVLLLILTHRLTVALEEADLLRPEQAAFRRREETIGQFIAMSEIVRRRHMEGESTICIFVDFKKAYDRVHHEYLFRVLEAKGFRGKFIDFLRAMYSSMRYSVRAAGNHSSSFVPRRGQRQGDPMSCPQFDVVMDDCLERSSAGGVEVPGFEPRPLGPLEALLNIDQDNDRTRTCPGSMFADDVLMLEVGSDLTKADEALLGVYNWGKRVGMDMGLSKCGVMMLTDDAEIRSRFDAHTFSVPDGEVPKVHEYKFLGILTDDHWHRSRENVEGNVSMELKYSKGQAAKGMKCLHSIRPLLTDRQMPLQLKVALVRNLVYPTMLYGAELIGFQLRHALPLQRVVDLACKWMLGFTSKTNSTERMTFMTELGLPPLHVEMSCLRARLHAKLSYGEEKLKTWIQLLHDTPMRNIGRSHTWLSLNRAYLANRVLTKENLSKYVNLAPPVAEDTEEWSRESVVARIVFDTVSHPLPLRLWASLGRTYELHIRSNGYKSPYVSAIRDRLIGLDDTGFYVVEPVIDPQTMTVVQTEYDWIGERVRQIDLTKPGKRTLFEHKFVSSVREVLLEQLYTSNKSVHWKRYDEFGFGATRGFVRNCVNRPDLAEGVRWLVLARTGSFPSVDVTWRRLRFSGRVPMFLRKRCPLCHSLCDEGWEWAHLMVSCNDESVVAARIDFLAGPIMGLVTPLMDDYPLMGARFANVNGVDGLAGYAGVAAIYLIGGVVNDAFSNTYHLGFGQLDVMPKGLDNYGWIFAAQFLQRIAPIYARRLQLGAYGQVVETSVSPSFASSYSESTVDQDESTLPLGRPV